MTTRNPSTVVVPENRYDVLADAPDVWDPSVAVVIPVYNGADRLGRVLDGMTRQTRLPDAIVVADDGSDENISAVVDGFPNLPIRYERQHHDGFGAGRARNLGVGTSTSDVILFVDADCIPHTELIDSHVRWHARTANLVVVGNRYHVDEAQLPKPLGDASLADMARKVPEDGAPDDWRRLFYSKSRWLRTGDDAFRAFVTSNVSVTQTAFEAVGGFAEHFEAWGGEDTELGWRLWNRGATFAVEPKAMVYHQIAPLETREGRDEARRSQRIALADAIPHRFYRPGGAAFYSIPQVSWIVSLQSGEDVLHAWSAISRSQYPDTELIGIGKSQALAPLNLIEGNDRVSVLVAGSVEDAVTVARGEFIVFVDGRVAVNPRFVSAAMELTRSSPRTAFVRGAYLQEDGPVVRSLSDIDEFDIAEGHGGLPLLAFVRRRELMKDIAAGNGIDWRSLTARCREGLAFEASEMAGIDSVIDQPSRLGLRDLKGAGAEQTRRAAGKVLHRGADQS
jgi:glycosyltransferase involved in cell wall biosynthesis